MSAIIVSGRTFDVSSPVKTWFDTGLEFRPYVNRRTRPRYQVPDTVVWHWTGGEGDGDQVYRTLVKRGLGVEFAIGKDGTIWQFCDPASVDARDCGSFWDRRSVGVETVNYGSRATPIHVPKGGRDRKLVQSRLRSRKVIVADFTPKQYTAAFELAEVMAEAFKIRDAIPLDSDGKVLDRPMDDYEAATWEGGHVGHLQITTKSKPDPGVYFLERLREYLHA